MVAFQTIIKTALEPELLIIKKYVCVYLALLVLLTKLLRNPSFFYTTHMNESSFDFPSMTEYNSSTILFQ